MAANLDWGTDINGSVSLGSVGRVVFSVNEIQAQGLKRISERQISEFVRPSANGLQAIIRTTAPKRTGALQRGLIVSPKAEATAVDGKVVYDIYPDPGMNDVFVKYSRNGTRYYYPASMEYGFRMVLGSKKGKRYPGKYYMRDTSITYTATHDKNVIEGTNRLLEQL